MAARTTLETFRERSALERLIRSSGGQDPSNIAGRLLDEFGSVGAVLAAAGSGRLRSASSDERVDEAIDAVGDLLGCVLAIRAREGNVVSNRDALLQYLRGTMAFARRETLRVIHLDGAHRIVADEVAGTGTVDATSFFVREIVARALEVGAVGMILVHNHPSGNAAFTPADVRATRELSAACRPLGVRVEDHLVVAETGISSMRDAGLLG